MSERFGRAPESSVPAAVVAPDVSTTDVIEPEQSASAAPTPSGVLGRSVASLGAATEPGLWLKTPLVAVSGPGRVRNPANGKSVSVTLIPIGGPATGGSRLSLQAMQALGVSLADLPEIEVIAGA